MISVQCLLSVALARDLGSAFLLGLWSFLWHMTSWSVFRFVVCLLLTIGFSVRWSECRCICNWLIEKLISNCHYICYVDFQFAVTQLSIADAFDCYGSCYTSISFCLMLLFWPLALLFVLHYLLWLQYITAFPCFQSAILYKVYKSILCETQISIPGGHDPLTIF